MQRCDAHIGFCLKQKTDEAVHEYPYSLGAVIGVHLPPPLPSQWLYKKPSHAHALVDRA